MRQKGQNKNRNTHKNGEKLLFQWSYIHLKLLQEIVILFACERTVKSIQTETFPMFSGRFSSSSSERVYVSYVAGCRETTG